MQLIFLDYYNNKPHIYLKTKWRDTGKSMLMPGFSAAVFFLKTENSWVIS